MKTMIKRTLVIPLLILSFLVISVGVPLAEASATGADRELVKKHAEFESFAQRKVRQLNDNHRYSRSRMQVVKQGDGTYVARYHQIDDASVKFKVKRSSSKSSPYVAVMSYRERVFESQANSPSAFDADVFHVVKIIPNRHIFSYQKGAWK